MVYEKMTAIANAIREKTGGTDELSLDGMAAAIPQVFASGAAAKQAEVDANVYIGTFKGSGNVNMAGDDAIYMPIMPDALCIFAFEPTVQRVTNCWTVALYDRRSFADMVGTLRYFTIRNDGVTNYGSGVQIASTAQSIYVFDKENKTMEFNAPTSNNTYKSQVWDSETTYFVFAFRYAGDKTDRELLTETVANLVDGAGRIYTFSAHRVNETVTAAEWDALTDTKEYSTFVLM